MMKVLNVVGARPNFVKMAPLMRVMSRQKSVQHMLLHTGQHYDWDMSDVFFEDLKLPLPDIYLDVGSGSQAWQTAQIMMRFEDVLQLQQPDLVLVVGDVNSTLGCSVVAAKIGVPVAHVEAGLRSFDRSMPEEINRIVTDTLSDYLFTTCSEANDNLRKEGIDGSKIFFVGNVMIDALVSNLNKAQKRQPWVHLGLKSKEYAILTLHRPSNVDNPQAFAGILDALEVIQREVHIVFPVHPRTWMRLRELRFEGRLTLPGVRLVEPFGYLEFLGLTAEAQFVLTDSGGLQEETTVLGIPCLTLRDNTERMVTVLQGTNTLVGTDPARIVAESQQILAGKGKKGCIPDLWDGKAAERIVAILLEASSRRQNIVPRPAESLAVRRTE